MNRRRYDAIFILDQMPSPNVGGATTYNFGIVNACLRLGMKIFILVTTPRLTDLVFSAALPSDQVDCAYLHAISIGKRHFMSASPGAIARVVKRRLGIKALPGQSNSKHLHLSRYPSANEVARANRLLAGITAPVVFVDTIFRDPFVEGRPRDETRIIIGHDVFHERVLSFEKNGFTVSPRVSADEERRRVSGYDHILAISSHDAAAYRKLSPETSVVTVYPVVPPLPAAAPNFASKHVLYLGSAAHHNIEGLNWFLDEVWPAVLARHPDAVLDVVGSIGDVTAPRAGVRLLGRIGNLQDATRNVAFAVNPVRMGSGIKIKMVDYFNAGLACVTTAIGAQGFPEDDRPFLMSEDAPDFADKICGWLDDPQQPAALAGMAKAYMRSFSQEAIDATLGDLVRPKATRA